jgi:exosortase/archaeosortase family protein
MYPTVPKHKLTAVFNVFYLHFGIFLALFIFVSGIIGSWIIGTRLLYSFSFFIYGNLGKMVLFSSIAFFLLTRTSLKNVHPLHYDLKNVFYILCAVIILVLFFPVAHALLNYPTFFSNLPLSLLTHAIIIAIPVLLALGVFGQVFLTQFIKTYRKELLICLGISIVFYFAIFYVWQLWPYVSSLVLHIEYFLFSLSFSNVQIIPPLTLFVQNFGVKIEQACSGLDSLFLFTALYIFIGILDWKLFNHKKLLFMFLVAGIGLFLVNIFRVYVLILAGVYISPVVTVQLFHTYLGMVLFIIYFALFWKSSYKWLRQK